MIRNVVGGQVKPGVSRAEVGRALQALLDLRVEGVELRMSSGLDLGPREGNASSAITVDLDDEQAYRTYGLDEEHSRIRRELFAPISERVDRIQFAL
ncbi:Dabb family protein [Pseudonocardia xishanensis]